MIIAGFAGCADPSIEHAAPTTVTVTQVSTPTSTAPPAPPTFVKLTAVYNNLGYDVELRVQPYTLDSAGQPQYSRYSVTSIRANGQSGVVKKTDLGSDSYPKCDGDMQGISVILVPIQTGKQSGRYTWPGEHCIGETKAKQFGLKADGSLTYGDAGTWVDSSTSSTSSTAPTGEDAAVTLSSPQTGFIYLTLVKEGANGNYSVSTNELATPETAITVDGNSCGVIGTAAPSNEGNITGDDDNWTVGETIKINNNCGGATLVSGSTHFVSVSLHGTLILDNSRVVIN
jgi:hypothetical protein